MRSGPSITPSARPWRSWTSPGKARRRWSVRSWLPGMRCSGAVNGSNSSARCSYWAGAPSFTRSPLTSTRSGAECIWLTWLTASRRKAVVSMPPRRVSCRPTMWGSLSCTRSTRAAYGLDEVRLALRKQHVAFEGHATGTCAHPRPVRAEGRVRVGPRRAGGALAGARRQPVLRRHLRLHRALRTARDARADRRRGAHRRAQPCLRDDARHRVRREAARC